MSAIYDNWERLVGAVLKKEQLWQLFHADSVSISSDSSGFSFSHLSASLDDVPFAFPASSSSNLSTNENVNSTPLGKRGLMIEVPELRKQQSYPLPLPPSYPTEEVPLSSYGNVNSTPLGKRDLMIVPELRKQRSYPLPLPPNSASRGQERAQDIVESPGSPWKKGKFLGGGLLGGVYIGFNRLGHFCFSFAILDLVVAIFAHSLSMGNLDSWCMIIGTNLYLQNLLSICILGFAVGSENGAMCAMKEFPLSSNGDVQQSAKILEKEILQLSCMRHPNIVQYYGSETVAENFYLYYEYMSRGTIYTILEQYGKLGEPVISSYTQQILSGLAYLHSKSIAHRDIKGGNILIDPKGRVKLTNFGIEKQIAERFHTSWMMDSPCWMAPEVIMNPNVCNLAADIWSLGCTVLEMATSKPPQSQYAGVMAMSKVAYHKDLPTIPDHLSDVCKDFIRHCLRWDPWHRASVSQLLEHPFVKGFSPLGERMLVSTSSVTYSVKLEGSDGDQSDSHSCKASTTDFRPSDIYTPRSVLRPRLPQQTSPPPKSFAAIQHTHLKQSTLHQHTFRDSYWDPNTLRVMFR